MTQAGLWWGAGLAGLLALIAGATEWRASRRRDLDRIGLVPWGTISLLGFVAALISAALALRG